MGRQGSGEAARVTEGPRRALAAWLLGLAATLLTVTPSLVIVRHGAVAVTFEWMLFLAALPALAYGLRLTALSSVGGLVLLLPFALWPNNGYANLVSTALLAIWLFGQASATEMRRRRPRFWNHPLAVQLPLSILYGAVVYLAYPWALARNPAPWCAPECVTSMSAALRWSIALKSFVMLYAAVAAAGALLRMPGVRRLLALPPRPHGRLNARIVGASVGIGIGVWLLGTALSSVFASTATGPYLELLSSSAALVSLALLLAVALAGAQAQIAMAEGLDARAARLSVSEANLRGVFDGVHEYLVLVDPLSGRAIRSNRAAKARLGEDPRRATRRAFAGLVRGTSDASHERGGGAGPADARSDIASATGEVGGSRQPPSRPGLAPAGPEPIDREIARRLSEAAGTPGTPLYFDATDRDGKDFPAEAHVSRCKVPGRGDILVCVVRDVSARAQLETELDHARKLDILGHLAGGIVHDLNNLMAGILGSVALLEEELAGREDLGAELAVIREGTTRAGQLTRQILQFARKEAATPELVDLHAELRDACVMLARSLPATVRLELELAFSPPPRVLGPRGSIYNAMLNMGVNAGHAMPSGGTLRIETAPAPASSPDPAPASKPQTTTEARVRLSVSDTGAGIAPEHLTHIFDPFFTTKAGALGTGIGLAGVRRAVDAMAGTIAVSSEIGRGTCFAIELPVAELADPPGTSAPSAPGDEAQPAAATTLVVDDDPLVRRSLRLMLERMGHGVLEAEDGAAAVAVFDREPAAIDLVLLDAMMPVMDGPTCFRALRQRRPDLPVVLATGFVEADVYEALRAAGLRGILRKPWTRAELERAVDLALDRLPDPAPDPS